MERKRLFHYVVDILCSSRTVSERAIVFRPNRCDEEPGLGYCCFLQKKRDSIYSTLIMTKKSPYLKGQMDSHILFCFLKVNIEILQTKRTLTGRPLTTQVSQANDSFPTIVFSTRAAKNLPKRSSNPFLLLRNPKKSCLFPSIL